MFEALAGSLFGLSFLFCCCAFACYGCGFYLFRTKKGKNNVRPDTKVWEAKHYYDPPPKRIRDTPDDVAYINFPSPLFAIKIQNGNGVYPNNNSNYLGVNPAVSQSHYIIEDNVEETDWIHMQRPKFQHVALAAVQFVQDKRKKTALKSKNRLSEKR